MFSKLKSGVALLCLIGLTGCTTTQSISSLPDFTHIGGKSDKFTNDRVPPTLADVKIGTFDATPDTISGIRKDGLHESAQSYGAQLGFARRSWEIDKLLEAKAHNLSDIYDFGRVVITAPRDVGVIVPPVVGRSKDAYKLEDSGQAASAANEYLKILSPAHLSPVTPTWRDYLVMGSKDAEDPPRATLPKDGNEAKLYQAALTEGYKAGIAQADATLEEKTNRLRRDYEGMLEYHRLVAQGMMHEMVLADADFGVTGDHDTMRIGERTVQIVNAANFNIKTHSWKPVVVSPKVKKYVDNGGNGN